MHWYALPTMSGRVIGSCLLLSLLLIFLIFRVRKSPQVVNATEEQALIATMPLRSGDMGDAEERKHILELENQLSAAIKESKAGEFDGDEFGKGVCTIYMYGPSAERLFSVARPILKNSRPPAGSYLIKRYGKPGSKQDRVAIDRDETPPK